MLVAVKTNDQETYQELLKKLSSVTRSEKSLLHSQVENLADSFEHLEMLEVSNCCAQKNDQSLYEFHGSADDGRLPRSLEIPNDQGGLIMKISREDHLLCERLARR